MKLPFAPTRGFACLALIAGLCGGFAQAAQAAPAATAKPIVSSPSFTCHWVTDPYVGWVYVCRPVIT